MFRPIVAALVLLLPLGGALAASCERIVAIGDLHGGVSAFELLLRRADLVDETGAWSGGGACLVQLGDIVDRGDRSRELLDRLIDLTAQAPKRVHVLLGNHEVMNIVGDLRYVSLGEFTAFAGEETAAERERGRKRFLETRIARESSEDERQELFDQLYPRGWFAHRRAFSLDGRYGRWLAARNVVLRLDGTLFVHGGLDLADAERGIEQLNRVTARDLQLYFDLRSDLERGGIVEPLVGLAGAIGAAQMWLEAQTMLPLPQQDLQTMALARRFVRLVGRPLLRVDGPLWNRTLALEEETELSDELEKILELTGTERIVIGHTTDKQNRIRARFDGRVFLVDTGAGPAYGGHPAALELGADGGVRAIYPDGVEVLSEPGFDDGALEEFLTAAEIVDVRDIGSGITRPQKVTLRRGERTMHAAFKSVDIQSTGMTRMPSGARFNFSDRYVYERAAYLVDRRLGLEMVPPAVLRDVDGSPGALIYWIESVIDEKARLLGEALPADPIRLERQRATMRLFDALIGNEDRNAGNQLYAKSDGRLYLIDHSRSFRLGRELSKTFTVQPASVASETLRNLEALDYEDLRPLLDDLLSRAQIKAMLARRDRILRKIREDIERYGEGLVVYSR